MTDATGNVIATYDRTFEPSENPSFDYKDKLTLSELHIFGSSRIGMHTPGSSKGRMFEGAISETGTPVYEGEENVFEYHFTAVDYGELSSFEKENTGRYFTTSGKKIYELSNHLGNVNVTISDQKIAFEGATGIVEHYSAEIISITDYYAFGSPMDGRVQQPADAYRYGFQNQETDEELWNGAVAYKYRVEDPRIGRFFSVDPLILEYAWNSGYSFSANRLIAYIELEGAETETPAYFRENLGYTTAVDNTSTQLSNANIVAKKVELSRQAILSRPMQLFQAIENANKATVSQYKSVPSLVVRSSTGQSLLPSQAEQQGKNLAEATGVDAAVSISIGRDLETNEDLSTTGYVAFAAGAIIEMTPLGKIVPEAAEKAIIGKLKSAGGRGLKLTNSQALKSANAFGWESIKFDNVPIAIREQLKGPKVPVFWDKKTNTYFTPDLDGHKADYAWKRFNTDGGRNTITFDGENFEVIGK